MPIKEKNKTLVKLRSDSYISLRDFLKDMFYKDETLSEHAYELLRLIYDRKELGLQAKNWKSYISSVFNIQPISQEEKDFLSGIAEKHRTGKTSRGTKPYEALLSLEKKGQLELTSEEKQVLEKTLKWNSCVSSYYSVINKLRAVGLIEKKAGRYHKSSAIFDRFEQIKTFMNQFETDIRS